LPAQITKVLARNMFDELFTLSALMKDEANKIIVLANSHEAIQKRIEELDAEFFEDGSDFLG
jgi:hypothetical protein